MAGVVLGTGSGVLAAAAVYYTLSVSLTNRTSALRSELHSSSNLLRSSFDPSAPIPASALIGPPSESTPPTPSISNLVRQKWNASIASAVQSVSDTNWPAVGMAVYEESRSLVSRLTDNAGVVRTSAVSVPDVSTVSGGNVRDNTEKVDGFSAKVEIKRAAEGNLVGRLV